MTLDVVQLLYDYNTWANERLCARVAALSAAQFTTPIGTNAWSVRETLVHTLWGQALWLSRWQGQGDVPDEEPSAYTDVAILHQRWRTLDAATHAFIDRLDEATLHRLVHYRIRGEDYQAPLWHLMLHPVNHATQHRSEVALMLAGLGHSPGPMDLVIFLHQWSD